MFSISVSTILEFPTTSGYVRKLSRLKLNTCGEIHMFHYAFCQVDIGTTKAKGAFYY